MRILRPISLVPSDHTVIVKWPLCGLNRAIIGPKLENRQMAMAAAAAPRGRHPLCEELNSRKTGQNHRCGRHGETGVEELGKPNSNKLLISSDGTRVSWGSGTVHPTHPQTETPASMWMDAMCKRLRGAVMQSVKSFYVRWTFPPIGCKRDGGPRVAGWRGQGG